ncbi:MAG: hotdog domain-containing protein [Acidobacteriota bacterium]
MTDGDVIAWERTFTEDDIQLFGRLSGDEGEHHAVADQQGRLMVQGLLTATLPTKIGGDLNFIARELTFEFLRPVFAGDTVRCEVTVGGLEQTDQYTRMSFNWVCRNQQGKEVMTGRGYGVIKSPSNKF